MGQNCSEVFEIFKKNSWLKTWPLGREYSACTSSSDSQEFVASVLKQKNINIQKEKLHYQDIIEDYIWSLSHTKNTCLFSLIPQEKIPGIFSIGVDIEYKDREISEYLKKKYINDQDISMSALKLWTIKEAAFKVLSKSIGINFDLKNIIVEQENFRLDLDFKINGKFYSYEEDQFQIALAYL